MDNKKNKLDVSLAKWYYEQNNEEGIPYEIYSYWDEDGNLSKLFEMLEIDNVNIGESIKFAIDTENLGFTRDLGLDFNADLFRIINIQHEFSQEVEKISRYKCYELEPVFFLLKNDTMKAKKSQEETGEVRGTGMSFWMYQENGNSLLNEKIKNAPKGKSFQISEDHSVNEKLKSDVIHILTYFENGLSDIEQGSEEKQPMLKEIRSALKRLQKL